MANTPTVDTSVPQPVFEETGISLPSEADILVGVVTDLNAAFGNNLTFYNSSGAFLASRPQSQIATTQTAIINDSMGFLAFLAASFDPAVASGRIQDGIAAINFLTRKSATATSVTCTVTGAAGTVLPAGLKAQDTSGNTYANAGSVTIGTDGTATATFNCTATGPISCPAGTLTQVYQVFPGWDTITNPTDGITGTDTESRSDLEARRQQSVMGKGSGTLGAIKAQVLAVSDVIDAYVSDNSLATATTIGGVSVPAHGILVAVAGGTDADIATAIWQKRAAGTPMAGDTTVTVEDTQNGYSAPYPTTDITFQRAVATPLYVKYTLTSSEYIPEDALTSLQNAALSAFNGTGSALTNLEKINSIIYGSSFVADAVALGAWVKIVSVQVSLDGTTFSDTVSLDATKIPTLTAANISMALV